MSANMPRNRDIADWLRPRSGCEKRPTNLSEPAERFTNTKVLVDLYLGMIVFAAKYRVIKAVFRIGLIVLRKLASYRKTDSRPCTRLPTPAFLREMERRENANGQKFGQVRDSSSRLHFQQDLSELQDHLI